MFWLKRPKVDETEASWAVPYGDLMSLLLAVFVMIAAMSEIRSPDRFSKVNGAVKAAFGFSRAASPSPVVAGMRSPTLLERLERAGFARKSTVHLVGPDDRLLAACDAYIEQDRITMRVAGHTAFDGFSAALRPEAERAVRRIAELLADGRNRIEIRGHNGDGPLPAGAPFRDGLDLSYARARAVAVVLTREGVDADRIHVTAWGDSQPLAVGEAAAPEVNRRIEIVVDPVPTASDAMTIAEKDQVEHD